MRIRCRMFLALSAMVLISVPAIAQRPGGPGLGGAIPGYLRAPGTQAELKMTDEQSGKVNDTLQALREKYQAEFQAVTELPPGQRFPKTREMVKKVNDAVKKDLSFTAEQSKRFDQMSLQMRGLQAFGEPDVQEKLALTQEQKVKIRDIGAGSMERMREVTKNAAENPREAMIKGTALRKELMGKALEVLTDDQKKGWKELIGEPFEVRFERPGA